MVEHDRSTIKEPFHKLDHPWEFPHELTKTFGTLSLLKQTQRMCTEKMRTVTNE